MLMELAHADDHEETEGSQMLMQLDQNDAHESADEGGVLPTPQNIRCTCIKNKREDTDKSYHGLVTQRTNTRKNPSRG